MQKFFDTSDIFGNIDANRVVFDFSDANLPTVFHPAKLFELFDAFEFALGKSWVFKQGVALKNIKAQVFKMTGMNFVGGISYPRYRCS